MGGRRTPEHRKGSEMSTIPVIDVTDAFAGDKAATDGSRVRSSSACTSSGFFYIRGHGVPQT